MRGLHASAIYKTIFTRIRILMHVYRGTQVNVAHIEL